MGNTWILKKVFADATKVVSRSIEKWKKSKSYMLLDNIHTSIYTYIPVGVSMYVIYYIWCNGLIFKVMDYPLSMCGSLPPFSSFSPQM